MSRKTRIILGLLILAISISLLIWGSLPGRHETRTQPIAPADLQLPTPSSLYFDTCTCGRCQCTHPLLNASLIQPIFVA